MTNVHDSVPMIPSVLSQEETRGSQASVPKSLWGIEQPWGVGAGRGFDGVRVSGSQGSCAPRKAHGIFPGETQACKGLSRPSGVGPSQPDPTAPGPQSRGGDMTGPEPGRGRDASHVGVRPGSPWGSRGVCWGQSRAAAWRRCGRREGGTRPAPLTQFPFPTPRHPDGG